ncbi:MAG: hypothetical protein A2360_04950 [Candidatus Staskawiczbacteria bacterium RIFOXYB1_FULL_32_11]|uniref:Uncharacterized protein n=1 Tax=Candidatus Staskawiczbacteria bacterium RIFOXYD1_FULL_32_13 TaxID=1802234 RepID=A0A1G2JM39_9BACT|nr:MAG: hypothetical protein UR22_C0001G0003 [Parcubacteria group bacterium GW2011_GWC2_32_10]OGZ77724.1 MAG: hypothetical protein A2256_01515 [Candidatus Staskawiczbacteria bacterium RIFOXYA2_FULL_32_7]OGZ79764.1 MAG: hypothetical protein A2360_04950 [Candidatus Staskawiczbacteria bacterium RIFOXYB1_FULL_32_11]OGZ88142.1 MAG: hypothetical protein A2561_05545 [Candidatus Staskawiczbacteria bacterium RIFOXYD1_FULL_32_13]
MKFNPDNLNIHELAIEEPEKQAELPFDFSELVSAEDLQELRDELNRTRERQKHDKSPLWGGFCWEVATLKLMNKNEKVDLDEQTLQGIRDNLLRYASLQEWDGFSAIASSLKISGITDSQISKILLDNKNNILKYFESLIYPGISSSAELTAKKIKIIYPGVVINTKDLSLGLATRFKQSKHWLLFCQHLTYEKFIDFDCDIPLDQETKDKITNEFKTYLSKKAWSPLGDIALAMNILNAKRINITDKGVEFITSDKNAKSTSEPQNLPEQKQF